MNFKAGDRLTPNIERRGTDWESLNLTPGKVYVVESLAHEGHDVRIVEDRGVFGAYNPAYFSKVEDRT